jgi:hypothetical protein
MPYTPVVRKVIEIIDVRSRILDEWKPGTANGGIKAGGIGWTALPGAAAHSYAEQNGSGCARPHL